MVHGKPPRSFLTCSRDMNQRTAPPHPVPTSLGRVRTCPLPRRAAERVYAVDGSRNRLPISASRTSRSIVRFMGSFHEFRTLAHWPTNRRGFPLTRPRCEGPPFPPKPGGEVGVNSRIKEGQGRPTITGRRWDRSAGRACVLGRRRRPGFVRVCRRGLPIVGKAFGRRRTV